MRLSPLISLLAELTPAFPSLSYSLAVRENKQDRGAIITTTLLPFLRREEDNPASRVNETLAQRQRDILFGWLSTLTSELRELQPAHRGACLEAVAAIAERYVASLSGSLRHRAHSHPPSTATSSLPARCKTIPPVKLVTARPLSRSSISPSTSSTTRVRRLFFSSLSFHSSLTSIVYAFSCLRQHARLLRSCLRPGLLPNRGSRAQASSSSSSRQAARTQAHS